MSESVTTDASQHTNNDDRILEIPNRCDDATLIEQWRSALLGPMRRVIRTMCYDIRTSTTLLREVDRLRHDQRAVYNRVIESLPPEGGDVPALQKGIKLLGLETLPIAAMGTSARARGRTGVSAKNALNTKLHRALWGFTRATFETAFETASSEIVYVPAQGVDTSTRRIETEETSCAWTAPMSTTPMKNAACNIRQRTIEILTLHTAGHSPTKALILLWKNILANTKRYAKNAKNTRTRNPVAREGENQPADGQRPTHHAAGRVPCRSAIAGEKRQTSHQAGLLSNTQHPVQQRHKNSITSVRELHPHQ